MSKAKIQAFNRANLAILRQAMQTALEQIQDEFDVKITFGSGSFTDSTFSCKLNIGLVDVETGVVNTPERESWKRFASMYGFKPEDLDRTFTIQGTNYAICGLNTRRPKFPILAIRASDGRKFKFSAESLKRALS